MLAVLVTLNVAVAGEDKVNCKSPEQKAAESKGPGALALVAVGVPMALTDYVAGVTAHEGMHCLSVEMVGGKCKSIDILPSISSSGSLRLGVTEWSGNLSPGQEVFVLLAPKILDLTLMGGYAALRETGSLPQNKWGQLALVIAATGGLVDYSKHFVIRQKDNDVERAYTVMGVDHGLKRVPFEVFYGATIAAGAYEIGRGWYQLFRAPAGASDNAKPNSSQLTKYGSPTVGVGTVGWQGEF